MLICVPISSHFMMANFLFYLCCIDDILFAYHDMKSIDLLKEELNQNFEMKDLGAMDKILWMKMHKNMVEKS